MIDVGIENIQEIVELSPSLNILEIFDDVDYFCHITRYLFSLHAILDKLSLTDKYQTKYMSVLSIIFRVIKNASSNENATRFSYITLNAMLTNTLSSEEMWFIDALRDGIYLGEFYIYDDTFEFMIFSSIYLYFLARQETYVSNAFKVQIEQFISKTVETSNYEGNSWKQVLNQKLEHLKGDEACTLLEKLLAIYDCIGI